MGELDCKPPARHNGIKSSADRNAKAASGARSIQQPANASLRKAAFSLCVGLQPFESLARSKRGKGRRRRRLLLLGNRPQPTRSRDAAAISNLQTGLDLPFVSCLPFCCCGCGWSLIDCLIDRLDTHIAFALTLTSVLPTGPCLPSYWRPRPGGMGDAWIESWLQSPCPSCLAPRRHQSPPADPSNFTLLAPGWRPLLPASCHDRSAPSSLPNTTTRNTTHRGAKQQAAAAACRYSATGARPLCWLWPRRAAPRPSSTCPPPPSRARRRLCRCVYICVCVWWGEKAGRLTP